jgi:hypothetical protein
LILLAFLLGHVADADAWLIVEDGARTLAVGNGRVSRVRLDDNKRLIQLGERVTVDLTGLTGINVLPPVDATNGT